jgi:hypothetical protein
MCEWPELSDSTVRAEVSNPMTDMPTKVAPCASGKPT